MATYQSLYRRYRSQRFGEVLGQDHITRALRNSVVEGRVGHAYLFSGPRGTGKTSTARILAKVLNCAAPTAEGEPCCACDNCVAVADGRVIDWLLEQDAASKSKVDDMRELLERVPLGTSGNRKVIILDEVHMLSQGAENALLKTLEEPPEHVVFVLATTDPQKVRPTIRSRTQHFDFKLLPPEVLADHVRRVIADADLGLGEDAVEHVVRVGGGSARDTLSALDQVAALGEVVDEVAPVDAIVDALCDRQAGAVLVAVADALAAGRDPRSLGEAIIASLRDAFLALMGAAETHLPPADRARAAAVGERLGAAGLTRALEVLGDALVELARKPDPRIVVEVALVRLTRPDTDRSIDAVLERIDRLERGLPVAGGAGHAAAPGAVDATPAPTAASVANPGVSGPGADADGSRGLLAGPSPAAGGPRSGGEPTTTAGSARPGKGSAAAARAALAGSTAAAMPGAGDPSAGASAPAASGPARSASAGSGAGLSDDATRVPRAARPASAASGASPSGDVTFAPGEPAAPASAAGPSDDVTFAPGEPAAPSPAGRRPTLRSVVRQRGAESTTAEPVAAAAPATKGGAAITLAQLQGAWEGQVLANLAIPVRSKWRGGHWIEADGTTLVFAVDNEWHQRVCEETRSEVEGVLTAHFGSPTVVAVVVEGGGARPVAPAGRAPARAPAGDRGGAPPPDDRDDEHIDPTELRDAGDTVGGVDLLVREFGAQLVEEDHR